MQYRKSICLREAFRTELAEFIENSITQDYSIITCADINENIYKGKLQWLFKSKGLIEISHLFSTETLWPLYITGSNQINSIWITANLRPSSISILPHYFYIEDYQYFVVDFLINYFIGDGFLNIIKSPVNFIY